MASNSAVQIAEQAPPSAPARRPWRPLRLGRQPFFDDKNRAFWIMQSSGWAGYFVLRTLSGIANSMGWFYIVHTALLTATGYSITLLMASAFRRLIRMQPIYTWVGTILIVFIAAAAFSAIETWSVSTFVDPGVKAEGVRFFSAILLTVSVLLAWSALYYSINFFILLEQQTDRLLRLESQ